MNHIDPLFRGWPLNLDIIEKFIFATFFVLKDKMFLSLEINEAISFSGRSCTCNSLMGVVMLVLKIACGSSRNLHDFSTIMIYNIVYL